MTSDFFNPEKKNHKSKPKLSVVYMQYSKKNFNWDFYCEMSKAQVHSSASKENEAGESNWKQWSSAMTMTWRKDKKTTL